MINVQSLHKSYGKKQILSDLNCSFEQGTVYGIVGKNGAGKTTLFKCLLDLETYNGAIECSLGSLKNVTGYLPTNPYFLSHLTGKEYLQLMCNSRDVKVDSFTSRNIFDLPLHRYAETYSTGMKKKLALTGVLLQKNEVFILDEPFNGVDIEGNMLINEVIQKLKELGKTIIISSHIFSTLKDNCDMIYYLEDGTISEGLEKDQFSSIEQRLKGAEIHLRNFDL